MAKVKVVDMTGKQVEEIEIKDEVFGIEPNEYAVHEVVKNYLANQRQGTQSARTRSDVRGGGAKPFRQKGTGRARQGSRVSPVHVGGGVVFAPKPRDYSYTVPKKLKRLAMRSVLSAKIADKELIVIDKIEFEQAKTKEMINFLEAVKAEKKALLITEDKNENTMKSARNIKGIKTGRVDEINVYDILNHSSFIITKNALNKLEEVYS